ncbi:ribonuclease 4-like [Dromiciops gliroides]|uniref:ribonuclease 4-like n=1 Tax=Dromiciops gliroides TaxID=33562 RepID=UPI001CC386DF|nr:ribonuclease 4-like [Dromiciops gliroides]XP_043840220.1 ribonuclease 4-like [Dromiciops gliroides]
MAMQGIRTLLLLLALLGLWLVQPSSGQVRRYQQFLRQHVDPTSEGGDASYCNQMMHRRRMTVPRCKPVNSFIHEDIWNINSICHTVGIKCKNGQMNCHEGIMKVTDCRVTGGSVSPNCRYRATARTRHVAIACDDSLPVHFDG